MSEPLATLEKTIICGLFRGSLPRLYLFIYVDLFVLTGSYIMNIMGTSHLLEITYIYTVYFEDVEYMQSSLYGELEQFDIV